MSKRNRNRFRDRNHQTSQSSSQSPVVQATSLGSPSAPRAQGGDLATAQHSAEYRIISADLIRLVVLNAIILVAVLVVYYTNNQSGYLERLFEKLF